MKSITLWILPFFPPEHQNCQRNRGICCSAMTQHAQKLTRGSAIAEHLSAQRRVSARLWLLLQVPDTWKRIPMGWLAPGSKITYLERWSLEGLAHWNNPLLHSECILCFSMATVVIAEYKKHSQLQLDCSHALWIRSLWRTRPLIWIATALK